jgi:GNAT superfamily N-acetyltransferase
MNLQEFNRIDSTADRPSLPAGYEGLIEITRESDLEEVFSLRANVWKVEEEWLSDKPDAERLRDTHEVSARHWVVRHQGSLVAAVRLSLHDTIEDLPDYCYLPKCLTIDVPPPIASLNRLVVDPGHRCQGLGTALDQFAVEMARRQGANAVLEIVPPYRVLGLCRRGFKVLGRIRPPDFGGVPATILLFDLRHNEPTR